jgi:hypothetical protein
MIIFHYNKIKKNSLFSNRLIIIVLIVVLIARPKFIYAQSKPIGNSGDTIPYPQIENLNDTTRYEKDLIDIIRKEFNFKHEAKKEISANTGLGPYLSFFPVVGYAIASGYVGAVISNISFFTSKKENKISSVLLGLFYSQYNQYWSIINSNIYAKNGKYNFVGDWRLYKFPTKTFGLGSSSLPVNADKIDYSYVKISEVVLQSIFPNFYFGPGYHFDYHSNIKELNKIPIVTDFQKYGLKGQSRSSGISLNLMYDSRANSINPVSGTYCNLQYRHNFTFLGSEQNWKSIIIDAREYIKLPAKSRNVLALWSYNNFTFGNPPYLDLPSTGWDAYNNTGRGYAQGRFRGKNLIYFESEYRFLLTRNGLFGAVIFANGESFSEWPSNNIGKIVPGYGIGARIKINKHSRTNLAIDYGFGNHGSKGFSFNLGELF